MFRSLLLFLAGCLVASGYFLYQQFAPVPASPYVSKESAGAMDGVMEDMKPHMVDFIAGDVHERRAILDEFFFGPRIAEARELYPVTEQVLEIDVGKPLPHLHWPLETGAQVPDGSQH